MDNILSTVADFMALSARTAPKAKGDDFIVTAKLEGAQLEALAAEMDALAGLMGKPFFARDAANVRISGAVLLVGIKGAKQAGLNCGACGFATCAECQLHEGEVFNGPSCAMRLIDLGIALGSAARTAMQHCADSRIMYSVGSVAVQKGYIDADVALGIPLSASGKSPYFDRVVK